MNKFLCWLFGHIINTYSVPLQTEEQKKKKCTRCGTEVYDYLARTFDDIREGNF